MPEAKGPFKAYLIESREGKVVGGFACLDPAQLDAGEVLIRVAYSSVNYKDALAATGAGKIVRRFPCVGGIDLAGTVIESDDARFSPGQEVIATSFDIGVAHHGGYAEVARIPAGWVVPLPKGLSLKDSMAIGTAGFTAALGIQRLEENGLRPDQGKIVVTGSTGGVGSLAVNILARLGYHVVAVTGKDAEHDYLKSLGAKEVLSRNGLDMGKRPLETALWAGAYDTVGGEPLAWILRTLQQGASVAACGLTAGHELHTTVMPFILRGNNLLGVDSGYWPMPSRQRIWERLANDMRPPQLGDMTRTIGFNALPGIFDDFLKARVRGRIVVDINA